MQLPVEYHQRYVYASNAFLRAHRKMAAVISHAPRQMQGALFLRWYFALVREFGFAIAADCCDDAPWLMDLRNGNRVVKEAGGEELYTQRLSRLMATDMEVLFHPEKGKEKEDAHMGH